MNLMCIAIFLGSILGHLRNRYIGVKSAPTSNFEILVIAIVKVIVIPITYFYGVIFEVLQFIDAAIVFVMLKLMIDRY